LFPKTVTYLLIFIERFHFGVELRETGLFWGPLLNLGVEFFALLFEHSVGPSSWGEIVQQSGDVTQFFYELSLQKRQMIEKSKV